MRNQGDGNRIARPITEYFFKKVLADKKLGIERDARFVKPAELENEINSADIIISDNDPSPGAEGDDQGVGNEEDYNDGYTPNDTLDPSNNHKLLNIWNIFALSYSAYALWIIGRRGIAGRALAIILAVGMTFGAVIDLMPLRNDGVITVRYGNDELTRWLTQNTKPTDIFLSDRLLSHQILFTGHKLYLADALYPTSAGHDLL